MLRIPQDESENTFVRPDGAKRIEGNERVKAYELSTYRRT